MQTLLAATLPGDHQMTATALGDRYVVVPAAPRVPLFVQGELVGGLTVRLRCRLDRYGRYLAVEESAFKLFAASREPLIRLEFVSGAVAVPASHWQVHAERGAFSALLARAAKPTPHDLSSLHIPAGGVRMRPCFEDFLEFAIRECGVDTVPGWAGALADGRERWRRRQLGALVRDAAEDAAEFLRADCGYQVTAPLSPRVRPNPGVLRDW